jgi:hypothetical protein
MLTGGGGGGGGGGDIAVAPWGPVGAAHHGHQKPRACQWQCCQYMCAPFARDNLHH